MTSTIGVYTSLPPRLTRRTADGRDLGMPYLAGCVASWRRQGLAVRSVHYEEERALIAAPLDGVEYLFLPRPSSAEPGNPKPALASLLAAAGAAAEPVCAIANADLLVRPVAGLADRLRREAEGALVISSRLDLDDPWAETGTVYRDGYDVFVFDRALASALPDLGLIMGEPWWDYWLPLTAAFRGVRLKRTPTPFALHLRHPLAYSDRLWRRFGRVLYDHVTGAALRADPGGLARAFVAELEDTLGRHDPASLDKATLLRFSAFCVRWLERCAEPLALPPAEPLPIAAQLGDPALAWPCGAGRDDGLRADDLDALAAWVGTRMGRPQPPGRRELAHLLRLARALATPDGAAAQEEEAAALAAPVLALLAFPDPSRLARLLGVEEGALAVAGARAEAARPSARLAPALPLAEPAAADAPLSRMAAVEPWDAPGWAPDSAGDWLQRDGRTWETLHLLHGLERLGRLDAGARVLMVVRGPDPLCAALAARAGRVDVLHRGPPPAGEDEAADWLLTGDEALRRRLSVTHAPPSRLPDAVAGRCDAVVLPRNALLADGWTGAAALLEWAEARLAPGGVLAFSADVLVDGAAVGPWLDAAVLTGGWLERMLAEHTRLAVQGPFDAAVSRATLDRFAERDAAGTRLGSVWFLRKERDTGAAGWSAFRAAWTGRALGPQLAAMRTTERARRDGDGAVVVEAAAPAGLLLFGPYLRLPAGGYRLRLEGRAADPAGAPLEVEVVAEGCRLAWHEIAPEALAGGTAVVDVTVSADAGGLGPPLEFLVTHAGGNALTLTGLTLAPLGAGEAAGPAIRRSLLPRLSKTAIGRHEGGAVAAAAGEPAGHLLFGPYLPLPAGAYRLTVRAACPSAPAPDTPALAVEIVLDGREAAAPCTIPAGALADPVAAGFEVAAGESVFEVRISHLGRTDLRVDGILLEGDPRPAAGFPAAPLPAAPMPKDGLPGAGTAAVEAGPIGETGRGLAFLLGLPRSGTTLLSAMLDNHPGIASPPEPWIMLALEQLGRVGVRHPADCQLVGAAVADFCGADGTLAAIRAAARTLYGRSLRAAGKTLLVDKTPRYFLILDHLATVFPDAAFVWLLRDPLDVAASYRTTWGIDLPRAIAEDLDEPPAFDLPVGLERLERFRDRLGDRLLVARYEDLVARPAAELARVLAHLGLPAAPDAVAGMTDLSGAAGRRQGRFGDPKILGTAAPHARSVGGWREVFSAAERQVLLDAVGAGRLARLGYADTLEALTALGAEDRGEAATTALRHRAEAQIAARLADIRRVSSLDHPLSGAIQAPIHRLLSGDLPATAKGMP